jgi:glyoxylase-like metal-dependent hydrolase (beta-lactamase superfamily II)
MAGLLAVAAMTGIVACSGSRAVPSATVLDSYREARALLDSAVAVHGGLDALKRGRRIGVRMRGEEVWRNQSRRADPPYDREPFVANLSIDLDKGRLVWAAASRYPGGFEHAGRSVLADGDAFYVNFLDSLFVVQAGRTLDSYRTILNRMPHLSLLTALDNAATLRSLGPMRLTSGNLVDAFTVSTPAGPLTLGIAPRTRELAALLGVQREPMGGDVAVETEFSGYQTVGGLRIPVQVTQRTAGELTHSDSIEAVEFLAEIPDSLLRRPTGLREFVPVEEPPAVNAIAPGVWLLRVAGNQTLAVEFRDHVVLVETPAGSSAAVLAALDSLVPGKRVRYVVPTHHHDDHAGAVRQYLNGGSTLITTAGNRAHFERAVTVPSTLGAGGLDAAARATRIEVLTGQSRVLTDGVRTLELHDIGPSPHADEMVVAWLPREGIVFQGDLLNLPASGEILPTSANATTRHFGTWLDARGWQIRLITGTHLVPIMPETMAAALARPALRAAPE